MDLKLSDAQGTKKTDSLTKMCFYYLKVNFLYNATFTFTSNSSWQAQLLNQLYEGLWKYRQTAMHKR